MCGSVWRETSNKICYEGGCEAWGKPGKMRRDGRGGARSTSPIHPLGIHYYCFLWSDVSFLLCLIVNVHLLFKFCLIDNVCLLFKFLLCLILQLSMSAVNLWYMFFTLFDIIFLDTGVTCVSFLFDITVVNFCFGDINSTHATLLLDDFQVSITISLRFSSLSFEQGDWPNNIQVIQMSSTKFLFSTYPF